ncbi:MAG: TatD family hydrolase [Clostridiales bacterium]|nr:TatD family hydrolase [Candidatus Crickella merdequi]
MLFDAHTHLNFGEFSDEERKTLAAEIEESSLEYIIDVGDCVASSKQAIADAEAYEWCYAAVGIHPEHASVATDEDIEQIKELSSHPKVKAIGEIGLDFYYGKDNQPEQIELFRKQIRLANELRMPIMIHTRDANQLTMDILVEEGAFSEERKKWFPKKVLADGSEAADPRVQLHCFSGSKELAMEYVKLGAMISLGGPITFKNGRKAAEVAQTIPADYLLSETDAPYLTPEPFRGRQNKSQYVEYVVRRMAVLKNEEYDHMAEVTMRNGCRFFNIEE